MGAAQAQQRAPGRGGGPGRGVTKLTAACLPPRMRRTATSCCCWMRLRSCTRQPPTTVLSLPLLPHTVCCCQPAGLPGVGKLRKFITLHRHIAFTQVHVYEVWSHRISCVRIKYAQCLAGGCCGMNVWLLVWKGTLYRHVHFMPCGGVLTNALMPETLIATLKVCADKASATDAMARSNISPYSTRPAVRKSHPIRCRI